MKLPDIGDTITTREAVSLCRYFNLDYLVKRIESNPGSYDDWIFDGCSGPYPFGVWSEFSGFVTMI